MVATKELIEHHAGDEEEDLFPKVEKVMSKKVLKEMGAAMEAKFEELVAVGFQTLTSKAMSNTSPDVALQTLDRRAMAMRSSNGRTTSMSDGG